ncbi:tail terminator [Microbacterium phage Cen1621]|uniref:Tail terminator n=1 Tax=Microbacterium phage Cen1621 TaxID=2965191 RepID=A0A9E7QAN0_9CAUD|nr:tail terminator [Microbacterium phage Cen1621]
MSSTLIVYPYTPVLARDHLRQHLPLFEAGEGATVSTKPLPGADEARPLPYVQVSSDGGQRAANLAARDELRILVWHTDEGLAAELANLVEAVILAGPWPSGIRSITPRARPASPIPDPDTGDPMVVLGVTVAPAPRNL